MLEKIFKKKNTLDENLYTNFNDMIGYVGFITPDGGFYRVREYGSADGDHPLYAYYLLKKNGLPTQLNYNNNLYNVMTMLGYAVIAEDLYNGSITFSPTYDELTDKQKEIIDGLLIYYKNNPIYYRGKRGK